jgi:hypothetical protein
MYGLRLLMQQSRKRFNSWNGRLIYLIQLSMRIQKWYLQTVQQDITGQATTHLPLLFSCNSDWLNPRLWYNYFRCHSASTPWTKTKRWLLKSLQRLNLKKALLDVAFIGLLGCSWIRHYEESFFICWHGWFFIIYNPLEWANGQISNFII